jgi:hypothetical protein
MCKGTAFVMRIVALFLTLIIAGAVAVFFGWFGVGSSGRGDFCVQCGAARHQKQSRLELFGLSISMPATTNTKTTPLTALWEKYCGGCAHTWVFFYSERRSSGGGGYNACGFSAFKYPVGWGSGEDLSAAIEMLQTPEMRAIALRSIGNGDNWLRELAAGALRDMHCNENEHRDTFDSGQWWIAKWNLFTIETNLVAAEEILARMEKLSGVWNEDGFEKSLNLIDQEKRRQKTGP